MNPIVDYQNLANAIVARAAQDYLQARLDLGDYYKRPLNEVKAMLNDRAAFYQQTKKPKNSKGYKYLTKLINAVHTIEEVELFFSSRWCGTLTQLDGEYILKELKKIDEKDIRNMLSRSNYIRCFDDTEA